MSAVASTVAINVTREDWKTNANRLRFTTELELENMGTEVRLVCITIISAGYYKASL